MSISNLVIGVVGAGVVGTATAKSLVEHVKEVRVYDKLVNKSTHSLEKTLESDLIFVCLPTPQHKASQACELGLDTSILYDFFHKLDEVQWERNFVIKSTLPIGTTRHLVADSGACNTVHSPEFLTARCSLLDAQMPTQNIIGIPQYPDHNACAVLLAKLYRERFPHVPSYFMRSDESEAIKLFVNSFYAMKVAAFNELRTLADAMKLNWDVILYSMLATGRIHPSHTQVPGPDGQRGFGGTCLPKDLNQVIAHLMASDLPYPVTCGAEYRNRNFDRKEG